MMRVLLLTNGSSAGRPALDFGVGLAGSLKAPVRLVGMHEGKSAASLSALDREILRASEHLRRAQVSFDVLRLEGRAETVVLGQAGDGEALAVIGPQGRTGWLHWLRGPAIRHIVGDLAHPIIYVPGPAPEAIRRILICSGGLSHAEAAVQLAGRLAEALKASVTLLHIAVPLPHMPEPVQDLPARPAAYLEADSLYSRNLRQARTELSERGLQVDFRLRQGDPLLEILAEIRSGGYDLVTIGSHSSLTGPARLVGDITARVVEGAGCPVLVVPGDVDLRIPDRPVPRQTHSGRSR